MVEACTGFRRGRRVFCSIRANPKSDLADISRDRGEVYSRRCPMSFFDDPEFQALIRQFVGDLSNRLSLLEEAEAEGDLDAVAGIAHKIVGCASAYGFDELGETARACETQIRSDGDSPEVAGRIEALKGSLAAAVASKAA
jgi:HPt (histidine-containing phosphotransfer) domain-containing protein